MSVSDRIKKANQDLILKDYENALIQVLIAVASTSKKRYLGVSDRKAFIEFLKDDFLEKLQPNISIKGGYFKIAYNGEMIEI